MAKVVYGPIVANARNKLGSQVYTQNPSGPMVRTLVTPTNPKTPLQIASRAAWSAAAKAWSATLTDTQRLEWIAFASTLPPARRGITSYQPSGFRTYMLFNMRSQWWDGSLLTTPPLPPLNPLPQTAFTFASSVAGTTLSLSIPTARTDTMQINVWLSKPRPAGYMGMNYRADLMANIYPPDDTTGNFWATYTSIFPAPAAGQTAVLLVSASDQHYYYESSRIRQRVVFGA